MKKVKAPYDKNEIVTVTVTDMGSSGEGIGRTQQGYTLFIKDAVIGDTVTARIMKANKSYGFARLEEVLVPSACALCRPGRASLSFIQKMRRMPDPGHVLCCPAGL